MGACLRPVRMFRGPVNARGKRPLVVKGSLFVDGPAQMVPCQSCVECRLNYSAQWAMRCMHEKRMHAASCFLTLTYAEPPLLHGPCIMSRQTLEMSDLQKFWKRLRYFFPEKFRYYACGEYGEQLSRPHYHAVVFGMDFPDLKFLKNNKRGEPLYSSNVLSSIWQHGHCAVGEVTFESAAYCARYMVDLFKGDGADAHYAGRQPEFVCQSNNLGKAYYMKYAHEMYAHDSCIIDGREVPLPRYYDDLYYMLDPMGLKEIKLRRRRKAAKLALIAKYVSAIRKSVHFGNLPERTILDPVRRDRVRETITLAKLHSKRKGFS